MTVLLQSIHNVNPTAAIFSAVPGYARTKASTTTRDISLPLPLSRLSEVAKCSSIVITEEEASFLEQSTRGQASTMLWFEHHVGRITASLVGHVAKCKGKVFPSALVFLNRSCSIPKPVLEFHPWLGVLKMKWLLSLTIKELQKVTTKGLIQTSWHSSKH